MKKTGKNIKERNKKIKKGFKKTRKMMTRLSYFVTE